MISDEMVRKVAQAITDELMMQDGSLDGMITLPEDMELEFLDQNRVDMGAVARAALEAIAPAIRAEALEEAGPAREIAAERQRQISAEGWTPEHDDAHEEGSLACAAGCYAIHAGLPDEARVPKGWAPQDWPWGAEWWKPKDRRSDLVRAGALILAEIERLDRAALKGEQP